MIVGVAGFNNKLPTPNQEIEMQLLKTPVAAKIIVLEDLKFIKKAILYEEAATEAPKERNEAIDV
ncbi:hypothetical protein O9G_005085 [Rozella allomycis CSF55]|uniref:Uncharacterized protein n=1 Tax=Rozella allomycis (strain CSF55) TaxID=988480 RepID=A0A075B4U7_ROZAC|nr:hypothetical protein O9G_005085 [Rozella allomycis CSF55]|eukprot:EPZ36641.1 hypothetical protein O9G_005085 [Rozella allomycis CSF55]